MSDSADDITWHDDPIELIRSRPAMFLRGGFHAATMAGQLAGDALLTGAGQVIITRFDAWHIVSADMDWLSAQPSCSLSPQQAFFHIVVFPEAGPNSMRSEVLLTAFASKVISASLRDRFVVAGDVPAEDEVWSQLCLANTARSIAFQSHD